MSLLTTLTILFESSSENARKDIDDVDQSLDNVEQSANEAVDAFDDLDDAVSESSNGFFDLAENLGGVAAGLAVVTGLFAGITSQALGTDQIGKFSETLGLSIEDVSAWGEAVTRSGGSADSFRGSLASLTSQLTDINLTGGGEAAEVFARLGINARDSSGQIKDAFSILPELADSFQNLSKAESVGFGQKLGLDQGTILLLQQGRVAVEDLVNRQKQLGVATKEDYLAAAQFNDAWADTKQIFANLFTSAGTTILPLLNTILKGLENTVAWMKENDTLVEGFFIGVAGVVTYVYLPAMVKAAAATLAATAPFLLIGAAIAAVGVAFAILYEDVVAYLGGQESFIGDLAAKYEWFGEAVKAVVEIVKFQLRTMGDVFEWLTELISSPTEAIEKLGKKTKEIVDDVVNSIPDIGDSINNSFSGIKSFLGFDDEEVNANVNQALAVTGGINNNPLNGQTSASIVNSRQSVSRTTTVDVGGVNVNTAATDSEGVASAVNGTLKDQVEKAIGNYQDSEAY